MADLTFTGERFLPGVVGEIAHEHWHRYAFARRFVAGRTVLDVACGEGYGSALMAAAAQSVIGIDIAPAAVSHARETYRDLPNLRFEEGSAAALPLAEGSVDVAVSFETIEHLPRELQPRMMAELARVLAPNGCVVLSAPNPVEYSQARNYRNPFHEHEPARDELEALIGTHFKAMRWYRQRRYFGSAIWSESIAEGHEAWQGSDHDIEDATPPEAMYHVVIAARDPADLPDNAPSLSLFSDRSDAELARLEAHGAEVMRLDSILRDREEALGRSADHVRHLEELVSVRESLVQERDAQIVTLDRTRTEENQRASQALAVALAERDAEREEGRGLRRALEDVSRVRDETATRVESARQEVDALTAEVHRLERAIAAQERIIAYRQSARWWVTLPWMRGKLLWQRFTHR